MLKKAYLLTFLFISIFGLLFARNLFAAGGGPGPARFFFTDPDNYAAGGAIVVLQKNMDTGEVIDVTLDTSKVTLTRGNYFFGKLAPDCTGILEFKYPPAGNDPPVGSGSKYYDLRWVPENNLYNSNILVEKTNFFKIQDNFLPHDPGTLMYADLKVDGYDYDGDGTVTSEERQRARAIWDTNCGPDSPVYYGSGGEPTPTMMPWPPSATSTPTATPLPTSTPWPTATPLPTLTPTAVPTPTAIPSPTAVPTATPNPTAIPTLIPTPTVIPALSFSGVSAVNITRATATINWTTNNPSSSLVMYGTSINKISSATTENYASVISHQANLSWLRKGTKYYYKVYSRDHVYTLKTDGKVYSFMTIR